METNNSITSKKTLGSIIKVAISNIIKLLSGVLIGFLLPKIIGVTDYGYYKTFTLYATYVGLFHFGFADGIYLKFGGKDYNELDKGRFRFYTTFLFCLESIVSLVAAVIAFFALSGEYRFIFLCLAAYLLSTNITNHYQIISQITGRFNELSIRTIAHSILTGLAVFVLWLIQKFSDTLITYRIYTIIYVAVTFILTIWYIFTYRDITFGKQDRSEKTRVFWELIKLGFPLLVANLCSSFILSIDRQFVSILFDTDTYAIYSFAYNMLSLISLAMSAISTVVYPTLKRTDENTLKDNYSFLTAIIMAFVFVCLIVYFPLCPFVGWFLPQYVDSLIIFRVILPGLAISSAVTIIMHNYYKAFGKNFQFFVKSIIILVLSALANFLAYYFFKTTIAISIASIIVMVVWYVLIEEYFIRKFKIKWVKNLAYMLIMTAGFYAITIIEIWWLAMIAYILFLCAVSCLFYWKYIKKFANKILKKEKENGEENHD